MSELHDQQQVCLYRSEHGWRTDVAPSADLPAVVLIPGEYVLSFSVTMPPLKGRALAQAIPFACEDRLSQSVDLYHFITGNYRGKDVPVLAMLQSDYDSVCAYLSEQNIQTQACYPDYLALPNQTDTVSIYATADRLMLRWSETEGLSFDESHMAAVLPAVCEQHQDHSYVVYASTKETAEAVQQFLQQHEIAAAVVLRDPLSLRHVPPSMNMLLKQHRPKVRVSHTKRIWVVVAVVAVVSLMMYVGLQLNELSRYHRANHQVNQQLTQLYQRVFPGKALPDDPRSVLNPVLQRATDSGRDAFSSIVRKLGGVLQTDASLQLESLNYNDGKSALRVTAPSVAVLNHFIDQVSHAGLKVISNQISASGKNEVLDLTVEER